MSLIYSQWPYIFHQNKNSSKRYSKMFNANESCNCNLLCLVQLHTYFKQIEPMSGGKKYFDMHCDN